jgi:hypothetical protein
LQQRVGARAHLRLRRGSPVAEGKEADFFHERTVWRGASGERLI